MQRCEHGVELSVERGRALLGCGECVAAATGSGAATPTSVILADLRAKLAFALDCVPCEEGHFTFPDGETVEAGKSAQHWLGLRDQAMKAVEAAHKLVTAEQSVAEAALEALADVAKSECSLGAQAREKLHALTIHPFSRAFYLLAEREVLFEMLMRALKVDRTQVEMWVADQCDHTGRKVL